MDAKPTRPTNRYLLIEVGLILALIVLSILLYMRPAADGVLRPNWWNWPTLAVLFFAVAGLHTWRAKRGL